MTFTIVSPCSFGAPNTSNLPQMVYTSMLILIQISSRYATNLMDPTEYDRVLSNPKEVADRIYGSKVVIGLEQCMLFLTWGVKACMMALFWRLTRNLSRLHMYVKAIAVYIIVGFVVIMITYYAIYCRPFEQYWAMPVKNLQCATYQHYSITQAVFNISSDAAMLAIPIPLLMKAQMRPMRRVILFCVMSLGVFTIIAAILNKYFNFASPYTTTYQIWYIREASTAIYVSNIMCWWPLLRKIFGFKSFQHNSKRDGRSDGQQKGSSGGSQSRPSISLHSALKNNRSGYRKNLRSFRLGRQTGPMQSEEPINSIPGEMDIPLEDTVGMHVVDDSVIDLEQDLKGSRYHHTECSSYRYCNDPESQGSSTYGDPSSHKSSLPR